MTKWESAANFSLPGDEWNAGIQIQQIRQQDLPLVDRLESILGKMGLQIECLFNSGGKVEWEIKGDWAFGKIRQWMDQSIPDEPAEMASLLKSIFIFPLSKWHCEEGVSVGDFGEDIVREVNYSFSQRPGGVRLRHFPSNLQTVVVSWKGMTECKKIAYSRLLAMLEWRGLLKKWDIRK